MEPLIAFSAKVKRQDLFSTEFDKTESTSPNSAENAENSLTAEDTAVNYRTDAQRYCAAVYELLEDYGVPTQILAEERDTVAASNTDVWSGGQSASQGVRLWEILCDILDKMVLSLGERSITLKRFCELFKSMTAAVDLADIPQTLDQVIVGSADSVRLSSPGVVFVAGAVDGVFPHTPVASGIFSDTERRGLIELDLPMYDAQAQLALHEKYLAYTAVSAPTERLYISYYTHAPDGSAAQGSSIVSEVLRVLPGLTVQRTREQTVLDRVYCEKTAFECCAALYRQDGALSRALKRCFDKREEYSGRLGALRRAVSGGDCTVDSEVSSRLFGKDKLLSPSQIEKFYTCRFQYLCNYGLKLRERRRAEIDALEYGTLVHYMLENIIERCGENETYTLTDEQLDTMLDEFFGKYMSERMGGTNEKTDRFVYLYNRISDSVRRLSSHIAQELGQSGFKPIDFEMPVGDTQNGIGLYKLTDAHGNTVSVRGKIDRVDVMESGTRSYVRVVDYKTGAKEFKLADVLAGLNMQMILYLSAVSSGGDSHEAFYQKLKSNEICPSGILYMPAKVKPVTAKPTDTDENIQKEHDKNLCMNGLVLDEPQVLRAMDSTGTGKYIPVKLNEDGSAKPERGKTPKCVVSLKQLRMIFDVADDNVRRMSEILDDGNFSTRKSGAAFVSDSKAASEDLRMSTPQPEDERTAQLAAVFPNVTTSASKSGTDTDTAGKDKVCEYCPYKAVCAAL